ncbi:MAG TPA: AgmX/PglI C-terminal domain-containing protein [Hyalangium sp.]|nr:AgmX/PglI C-terminal domain-containing protein [Hyalangium sp.]
MSAQPSVLQVVILRDGLLVGTEVFVPGTYSIGSDPSSDLLLDDPIIEPRHAMLYFQNGRSAIQDAGSAEGVFVNGHRVTACEIRSVDEVLCGPFVLKTRVLSQKPAEKPPPSPEVAALLGAPTPAAPAPHAPGRMSRPTPQATMPARVSSPAVPAMQDTVPSQLMAETVPTAPAPQRMSRGAAPQPTGLPLTQPTDPEPMPPVQQRTSRGGPTPVAPVQQRTSRGGPTPVGPAPVPVVPVQQRTSRGGPAVAHAPQPMPAPVPVQPSPPVPVPANTVPSARRRATQDLLPVQTADQELPSSIQLASELFDEPSTSPSLDQAPDLEQMPPLEPMQALEQMPPLEQEPLLDELPIQRRAPVQAQPPVRMSQPRGQAYAHTAAPQGEPGRPTHAPKVGSGKGRTQLYLELYWGGIRRDARRFAPGKEPLKAATDELAPMPLWGFALPEEGFTLAEPLSDAFRLFVPPGSAVEMANAGGRYQPVQINALETEGSRRYITLRDGSAARLSQGNMSLVAYAAPPPEKAWVNPLAGMPWLLVFCFFLFGAGFGTFVVMRPQMPESPDFQQKNLPPVALRLLSPEPKKKEEAKKKLAEIKEKATKPEKKVEKAEPKPKVVEKTPPPKETAPPPPESKALKALAKLSAAGPATNDVLAAVDKLGSGPGSKNVKTSNYKLSGLIGKAPIANAGLGTFGLGGGGKGGGATLGAELLRGKGAGGIGALGAGGVGKGKVGGVVTRATSRSVATQGSIDREAVAKVINSHLQEVYACYERALLKDSGLAGKVVLEWTIGGTGSVVAAKTKSSTLRNGSVEACILSSLKKWQFPAPKGGVVIISYPFIFNSVGY